MLCLNDNVRIRYCGSLSFLIDTRTNALFCVQEQAVSYLLNKLARGLTCDDLNKEDPEFRKFAENLLKKNILKDTRNGA